MNETLKDRGRRPVRYHASGHHLFKSDLMVQLHREETLDTVRLMLWYISATCTEPGLDELASEISFVARECGVTNEELEPVRRAWAERKRELVAESMR